jgi:hypothetical protein
MKRFSEKELFGLARLIEIQLFASAATIEEYTGSPDVDDKLKSAAIRIIRRRLETKSRKIGGFRNKIILKTITAKIA